MNRAVLVALVCCALVLPSVAGCGKEYPKDAIANSVYVYRPPQDSTDDRIVAIWFYGTETIENWGTANMIRVPNCTVAFYTRSGFGSAGPKDAHFRGYYHVMPDGRVSVSFSPNPKFDWLTIDWNGELEDEGQTVDFGPDGVFANETEQ